MQIKNNPILLDNATKLFGVRNNEPGEVIPGFLGVHNLLHVQDRKAQNTAGGGLTSGAWRTRDLNSVIVNNIGASLAANRISLLAGTYYADVRVPAFRVGGNQAVLYNITGSTFLLIGNPTNARTEAGVQHGSQSFILGVFTLLGEAQIEVQHQCATTSSVDGGGLPGNFTTEVYTDLKIWKIS